MYKPAGLINITKHISRPKIKIPKTLGTFFFLVNLLGIDFGFVKLLRPEIRPVAKFLSVFLSLVAMVILLPPIDKNFNFETNFYWYSLLLIQYSLYFIILRFMKYSVCDFITDIYKINGNTKGINSEIVGVIPVVYFSLLIMSKLSTIILYCQYVGKYVNSCDSLTAPYYIYSIPYISPDAIPIVLGIIYYYLYCSARYLKELSKKSDMQIKLFKQYMFLTECFDKIKPVYDNLIIMQLVFEVPKMMGSLINMLYIIKRNAALMEYVAQIFYWAPIIIHIIVPAALAEMVSSQVEDIKLTLHNKLTSEKDEDKTDEINRMLMYLEARSLQHMAWRMVPVNLQLPVSLFSICTTYLIVAIQLTHLYD